MAQLKVSVRFYGDSLVRAVWDDCSSRWLFSLVDVVGAVNGVSDHEKNRNYYKYLKGKLRREDNKLVSATNRLKLEAPDGKRRMTDVADMNTIIAIAAHFPGTRAVPFVAWLTGSEDCLDGRSRAKAYTLFDGNILDSIETGSLRGLCQIHAYLFGGLYPFAGQVRTANIAKGGFRFAAARFLPTTLEHVERMPETTFDNIIDKYVEMNIAHPFLEGNGRAMRIWLDMMLRRSIGRCVDWSLVPKGDYLDAMRHSVTDPTMIKDILARALTDRIADRETFMKGIDYSYYYEQP